MINPLAKIVPILLLGAIVSRPCAAETPAPAPDDASDWTTDLIMPPKPGAPTPAPTTSEGGFSSAEQIKFGEDMRSHVLDQICRNAQIPLNHTFSLSDYGGLGVNGVRQLRVMPNNQVAIEDSQKVSLDLGHNLLTKEVGADTFGLWIGAHFDGTSQVIRPMPTQNSCDEIWRLLKLNDSKSVFPFKAERLAEMGVGELWKLPAVLTIGHAESLSRAFTEASGAVATPVISFGVSQTGAAMMTVYRMSSDKIRFRFRISHARIHNKSGAIVAVYPAIHVFTAPANILIKVLDSALTNQISHYLTENIGLVFTTSDGQQLMMEFILDPKNPQDMEELATVLKGDFVTLLKMAQRMVNLQASAARAQNDFKDLEKEQVSAFKRPANFPGLDINHTDASTLHLMLPFLFDHARGATLADDKIIRLDDQAGEVHIYRSEKTVATGLFDVPIKGQLVKHNKLMSAQAFSLKDKDGKTSAPQAVYIQQEGFLRKDSDGVRDMAADINGILSMIGAKGGAPNPKTSLPLDRLLPPEPATVSHQAHGQTSTAYPSYHDGAMAFTLVLNEKAVAAIADSAGELVVRSFANTLVDDWDRKVVNWILDNGAKKDGTLAVDGDAIKKEFNTDDHGVQWIRGVCMKATDLLKDVAAVRAAATPEARAQAMVALMSGRGKSDLAYDDMMKVLVQLVEPQDVTADLVMNINKEIKGDPNLRTHMLLKKNRPENLGLKAAGEAKNRFAQPSELVD